MFSLTRSVYFPDLLRGALFLKETHSNDGGGQTWPGRLEGEVANFGQQQGGRAHNSRPRWKASPAPLRTGRATGHPGFDPSSFLTLPDPQTLGMCNRSEKVRALLGPAFTLLGNPNINHLDIL